ncbi:MAG: aminoacyl-tRNA hydrolase [Flavobacteriaceae bacterium]|nr:aminoacyl-tRNA hydrolase [Flavobacteriaceae bacterium]
MNIDILLQELQFKAIRSSGSGGQHVNKVSSKVELTFDLENSLGLSEREKVLLKQRLASRLTNEHILILQAGTTRSQHRNKQLVIGRFLSLIKDNLKTKKKRKATRPTRASVTKRLDTKQRNSVKKQLRKKPRLD